MRETIVWILFCVLLALASFEAGYIRHAREKDDLYFQIQAVRKELRDYMAEQARRQKR